MRSIDLHWLSKKEKDISLPNFIYENIGDDCGGCYYNNIVNTEVLIHNKYYDCSKGLIVVNTYFKPEDKNDVENVIAHEWRHHCQFLRKIYDKVKYFPNDWNEHYEKSIRKYFLSQPCEMDALMFAEKYASSETTKWWISLIQNL